MGIATGKLGIHIIRIGRPNRCPNGESGCCLLSLTLPCEENMRISEGAQLRRLARDVCLQGVEDFLFGDPFSQKHRVVTQLAALQFLISEDFQFWADLADRDFDVNGLLKNATQAREAYNKIINRRKKWTNRTKQKIW